MRGGKILMPQSSRWRIPACGREETFAVADPMTGNAALRVYDSLRS
jgi:hypothetical protein